MAHLAGSVLTKRNASAATGVEARGASYCGTHPLALRRPCATVFSLAVMGGFLLLSACTKAPAPEIRAALPAQRSAPAPAPDPCAAPNTSQTHGRDIVSVSSPHLRPSDRGCPDYTRGFPSVLGGWTWPAPPSGAPERPQADRVNAERERDEAKAFQRRQRAGR